MNTLLRIRQLEAMTEQAIKEMIFEEFGIKTKKRTMKSLVAEATGLLTDAEETIKVTKPATESDLSERSRMLYSKFVYKEANKKENNEIIKMIAELTVENANISDETNAEEVDTETKRVVRVESIDLIYKISQQVNPWVSDEDTIKARRLAVALVAQGQGEEHKVILEGLRSIMAFGVTKITKPRKKQLAELKTLVGDMGVVVTTQAYMRRAEHLDTCSQNMIDKENELRAQVGAELLNDVVDERGIVVETRLQAGLASDMIKAYGIEPGKLADNAMVLADRMISDNITTFKFDKSILDFNDRINGEDNRRIFKLTIELIKDGQVAILYKQSGLTEVIIGDTRIEQAIANKLDGEKVVSLSTFMVSPSSLRTGAMTLAKVAVDGIKDDNRAEILNIATGGAFFEKFTQAEYERLCKKPKDLAKALGRLSQPLAAQKVIGISNDYVIFDNLCNNNKATDGEKGNRELWITGPDGKKMNAIDSKDGVQFIAIEKLEETIAGCIGSNIQTRGESFKCSSIDTKHRDLVDLYDTLIEMEVNITAYGVNGKMLTKTEFDALSKEEKTAWRKNLSMVTDENARKLNTMKGENGSLAITALKVAKDLESGLSMVTIMMMLEVDAVKTDKILRNKLAKTAEKALANLGVKVNMDEEGYLDSVNVEMEQNLNSSTLVGEHMLGVNPELIMKALPMSIAGALHNAITSINNAVNDMKLSCDAIYSVVQSDFAAMVGLAVLSENECYNPAFAPGQKVAASRHPISGILAVTTFTNVGLAEIRRRILALPCSDKVKRLLMSLYGAVVGYTVIPASKYLMEKHDGMDFDIDAMVIYLDADIVEVLSQIPNGGVVVTRTDADYIRLPEEEDIEQAQRKTWMSFRSHKHDFPTGAEAQTQVLPGSMGESKAKLKKPRKAKNPVKVAQEELIAGDVRYDIFNKVADSFYDYIASGIASVGAIVSSYYNNQCILNFLKTTEDTEMKAKVVDIFKKYYKCTGNKEYVTPFKYVREEKLIVTIEKMDCIEAVMRYKNSPGKESDLIAFLDDCCIGNRFPAETAIDAAKNFFIVLNYFKHEQVLKAIGSDKNMKVVLEENEEIYKDVIGDQDYQEDYGFTGKEINVYGIKFLSAKIKKGYFLKADMTEKEMIDNGRLGSLVPCIIDTLGRIKLELIDMANIIIAIAAAKLEQVAFSEDAIKLRDEIRDAISKNRKTAVAVNSVILANKTAMTATDELKKMVEVKDDENISSKEFEKTVVIPGIKNLVTLTSCKEMRNKETGEMELVQDFDKKDIGMAVLRNTLFNVSRLDQGDRTGAKPFGDNAIMLRVFEEELIIALNHLGYDVDKMNYNWDGIKQVKDEDDKIVNMDQFIGMQVVDGMVNEDYEVIGFDKKAANNGTFVCVNGRYYVMSNREFIKADPNQGITLKVVNKNAFGTKADRLVTAALLTGNTPKVADNLVIQKVDKQMKLGTGEIKKIQEVELLLGVNGTGYKFLSLEATPKKLAENIKSVKFDCEDVNFIGSPDLTVIKDENGNEYPELKMNEGIVVLRGANLASLLASMPSLDVIEPVAAATEATSMPAFDLDGLEGLEEVESSTVVKATTDELETGMPAI